MLPEDLNHFHASWPRTREYGWAGLAAALALTSWLEVVPPSTPFLEEEGARAAELVGEVIADRFSADPRDLPSRTLSLPLRCQPPAGQWIRQWGDGRSPFEVHPDGTRPLRCVNAERQVPHAP